MSAIRSVLLSAGRNKLADPSHINLSNQALGISGANRDGTKLPITDENLMLWSVLPKERRGRCSCCATFPISWIENRRNRSVCKVFKDMEAGTD